MDMRLNFDVQHIRLAVEDDDRTPASRQLVSAFVNSGYFDLVVTVSDDREVRTADRSGRRAGGARHLHRDCRRSCSPASACRCR